MAKGSHISYCTLMSFKHQHTTYITTITKGRRKLEYMEKGNKYHKKILTRKISLLHMREVEEKISNKIARLTYLGLEDHMHDFL